MRKLILHSILLLSVFSISSCNYLDVDKWFDDTMKNRKLKETEDFWISQFENKTVDKFTVVKQKPASDDQIEAITGSTITSKAMANGCNAAIYYFQNALGGAQ